MEEIWRPVKGYEGLYEVSNEGRVKSLDRESADCFGRVRHIQSTILRPFTDKSGYKSVCPCKNGNWNKMFIHRLVAQAFPEICGEWFDGCVVNHKDENPSNNVAWNLEVCTQAYNSSYGTARERSKKKRQKPVIQYSHDGEYIKTWESATIAMRELGINNASIGRCCMGYKKHPHAGGFKWEYAK